MPRILVDTWFWVALNWERDHDHDLFEALTNDEHFSMVGFTVQP